MKKINAAVIGFGLSGKVFHAPFLFTHPGFILKKIVERHSDESKQIYPEIEVVKNYSELLQNPYLDMIVVGTPNTSHFEMTKDCLEAGKHVVVEKPFTALSVEGEKLIEISEKTGKKIFVFHNRRWDGDFLTIQKIVEENLLGDIVEYEAHFDRYAPIVDRFGWRDEPAPGSGILYDLGPHLIDQAIQLFGCPRSLFANIQKQRNSSLVDDYFELTLYYDHLKAILKAGMIVKDPGPRYIIHGINGSFIKYGIDPQEEMLQQGFLPAGDDWGAEEPEYWGLINMDLNGLQIQGTIETECGNYHGFYDNVYDVLINNAEMAVKPQEASDVIRIIELAFESADKGKIINFR